MDVFSTPSQNWLFLILGSPRHPKSSQNGFKIVPRTAKALFSRLWLILGALERYLIWYTLPLFRSISDPGGYFFCSGVIFVHFHDFCVLGLIFLWIFMTSWLCFLQTQLYFLRQESAMNRQGSGRNRQDPDQFLHIHKHVSGVRRSPL